MSTVARLLRTRGDLATLGMNGFLARLLSFIDTNSAFLLGTNLYLREFRFMPHHQPFRARPYSEVGQQPDRDMTTPTIVNLERFIGVMNVGERR